MSSTSVTDLLPVFNGITWSFSYVILPICFILGNIGNALNLLIFFQPASRSNSCLLYFLSTSIVNVFILNFGLVLRILRGLWNIDPALNSLWFCRWRTFSTSTLFLIYRLSILFACIDRMCASSRSVWMRKISRPQVAYRLIALQWILSCVYFTPALVFQTIVYGQCLTPPNSSYATYVTISTLVQALAIPLSMIICGWITSVHLRSMQLRVAPMPSHTHNERQVVGKYITMLFVQVGADCLSNFLYPSYLIYSLVFPQPQSARIAAISAFLVNMSFTLPYLNFSAAFYLHTLSSPSFRRKLLRLLGRISWLQRWMPVDCHGHITGTMPLTVIRGRNTTVCNDRMH